MTSETATKSYKKPSEASLKAANDVVRVNLVKKRMEDNQVAHSLGLRICLSTEMPLLAARAGYSALLMNLEHSATGLETASAICTACMNVGYVLALASFLQFEQTMFYSYAD